MPVSKITTIIYYNQYTDESTEKTIYLEIFKHHWLSTSTMSTPLREITTPLRGKVNEDREARRGTQMNKGEAKKTDKMTDKRGSEDGGEDDQQESQSLWTEVRRWQRWETETIDREDDGEERKVHKLMKSER